MSAFNADPVNDPFPVFYDRPEGSGSRVGQRIERLEDCIGKRVTHVYESQGDDRVGLAFADGSYWFVHAEAEAECGCNQGYAYFSTCRPNDEESHALGQMSDAEWQEKLAEKRAREAERQRERDAERLQTLDAERRRIRNRLAATRPGARKKPIQGL